MNLRQFKEKEMAKVAREFIPLFALEKLTPTDTSAILAKREDFDPQILVEALYVYATRAERVVILNKILAYLLAEVLTKSPLSKGDKKLEFIAKDIDRGSYGMIPFLYFGKLTKGRKPTKNTPPRWLTICQNYNASHLPVAPKLLLSIVGKSAEHFDKGRFTEYMSYQDLDYFVFNFLDLKEGTRFKQGSYNYYFERYIVPTDEP